MSARGYWGVPGGFQGATPPSPPHALIPQVECMNFVKILHTYNRTHLYACGTGAFHPVCAFVEAGQHMEVSPNTQHHCGPQLSLHTHLPYLLPSRSPFSSWTPCALRMARGRAPMIPSTRLPLSSWVRESRAWHLGAVHRGVPGGPPYLFPRCLLGEELYSGVATDLMGRDFTIFRSLGRRPSIRMEQHDSRWLNGQCWGLGGRQVIATPWRL